MKMANRKSDVSVRAWNMLRIALISARKGGVFKRRFLAELHLVSKILKSIGHMNRQPRGQIQYGEKELSFDETPIIHLKMPRPSSMRFLIPCMNPPIDYDDEFRHYFDREDSAFDDEGRESFLKNGEKEEEEEGAYGCELDEEEQGIDLRAEEFIAKFYQEMRLQRQISHQQYN